MARRKRQFLDDGDSDSSEESDTGSMDFEGEDPDTRAERALFKDPYQRKKRRKNGSDDEDEDYGAESSTKVRPKGDWTKAPAFVSGEAINPTEIEIEQEGEEDEESGEESGEEEEEGSEVGQDGEDVDGVIEETNSSEAPEPDGSPSPRVQEQLDDEEPAERPKMGGIGSSTKPPAWNATGGIGSSRPSATHSSGSSMNQKSFPSAFGAARPQRSFIRDTNTSIRSTSLPPAELAHFGKLQGTFGARMLAKMGWETGTGLGVTGEGIVTPIDQKQRPGKIGLAYRGFKEKTEQSKAEAKRRGEVVSDEEGTKSRRAGNKSQKESRSDAWKKPTKKTKIKVVYKTYEEIMAEAGQKPSLPSVGVIIDARGATVSIGLSLILSVSKSSFIAAGSVIVSRRVIVIVDTFDGSHAHT